MAVSNAQAYLNIIMMAILIFVIIVALMIWALRTFLRQREVKNYVDVIIFHAGKHFQDWERFNCMKRKVINDSKLYSVELYAKKAPRVFPFEEEFAIKRKQDGKSTVMFIEVDGVYIPFLPDSKIENKCGEDGKWNSSVVTSIKDFDYMFGEKHFRDLVYTEMKNDYNLFKYQPKSGGVPWLMFLIIAGIVGIGLVLIMVFGKKKQTTGQ